MKHLLFITFILCLNIRHSHATFMPVSQSQLNQNCYHGSPMLYSDMCWGQTHGMGPWQMHQPMPWMGGNPNQWMFQPPGRQPWLPPQFVGGPIDFGDGIGDGTWGTGDRGQVRCMAIGCDPRDQFRYPGLGYGQRWGGGFQGWGGFNGSRFGPSPLNMPIGDPWRGFPTYYGSI